METEREKYTPKKKIRKVSILMNRPTYWKLLIRLGNEWEDGRMEKGHEFLEMTVPS